MPLNVDKTWEMVMRGNVHGSIPNPTPLIERKTWLKILGTILQENPNNWDMHFEQLINKANSRMQIMRVCKYYGMTVEQLDLLFNSLITSVLTYGRFNSYQRTLCIRKVQFLPEDIVLHFRSRSWLGLKMYIFSLGLQTLTF